MERLGVVCGRLSGPRRAPEELPLGRAAMALQRRGGELVFVAKGHGERVSGVRVEGGDVG